MNLKKEPLNERFERLRRARGLTSKEMARRIEVPESTYREWENGRGMKLPPFQKMSEVLAVSVTELLTGCHPDLQTTLISLMEIEHQLTQIRLSLGSRI